MKTFLSVSKVLLTVATLCFSSLSWAASSHSVNENFAIPEGDSSNIFWYIHPSVHYQELHLTVSADGISIADEVFVDEPILEGPLADGVYTWELTVYPDLGPEVKGMLKAARQAAGGQENAEVVRSLKNQDLIPSHRIAQSGSFTILDGLLVEDIAE